MRILVTGCAGFIGHQLSVALAKRGEEVVGIDNLNNYYNPALKLARLNDMGVDSADGKSNIFPNFHFINSDIADDKTLNSIFAREKFDVVCNLAAQAGVRYSIDHPRSYIESNIVGFFNILECCRHNGVSTLVYASSSSVYGGNTKTPFCEEDRVDNPKSLYAATKKSDELMARVYSSLYGIKTTGLRYFTVYGPWGRPDMSPVLFANAITQRKPIRLFNGGDMVRDFTYIDDIINGTLLAIYHSVGGDVPATVYNIGCSHPVKLMDFISALENALNMKAEFEILPMQPGDVYVTAADTTKISRELGYNPTVNIEEGTQRFIEWYWKYREILM